MSEVLDVTVDPPTSLLCLPLISSTVLPLAPTMAMLSDQAEVVAQLSLEEVPPWADSPPVAVAVVAAAATVAPVQVQVASLEMAATAVT